MDTEQKPLPSPDRRNFLRNAAAALTGAGLTAVGVKATEVSASPEQQPPQQQTETFYTRLGIHVESPVRAAESESPPPPEDTGGLSAISVPESATRVSLEPDGSFLSVTAGIETDGTGTVTMQEGEPISTDGFFAYDVARPSQATLPERSCNAAFNISPDHAGSSFTLAKRVKLEDGTWKWKQHTDMMAFTSIGPSGETTMSLFVTNITTPANTSEAFSFFPETAQYDQEGYLVDPTTVSSRIKVLKASFQRPVVTNSQGALELDPMAISFCRNETAVQPTVTPSPEAPPTKTPFPTPPIETPTATPAPEQHSVLLPIARKDQ